MLFDCKHLYSVFFLLAFFSFLFFWPGKTAVVVAVWLLICKTERKSMNSQLTDLPGSYRAR